MSKKISGILVFMLLCLLMFVGSAFADDDWRYDFNEKGITITGNISQKPGLTLEFPETLDGYVVTKIGSKFSQYGKVDDIITKVVIPNSITEIEGNPFEGCSKLKSFVVSLDHPTLAVIDNVLFSKPDKRLISYPPASEASNYSIPQGIEIIGTKAFYGCDLTGITISDNVNTIGDFAFGFTDLSRIHIPNSVTTIGNGAFLYCRYLKDVRIPAGVCEIGSNPFEQSSVRVEISPENNDFEIIDGVLIAKKDKRIISYPLSKTTSEYEVPQGIEVIGENAFCENEYITKIVLPDSMKEIHSYAFYYCEELKNINFPSEIIRIGDHAFMGCYHLRNIQLPEKLAIVENAVFYGCDNIYSLTIPDNVTKIEGAPFGELDSITIPASVVEIADGSLSHCATVIVSPGSFAEQYCKNKKISYTVPGATDWLNS